MLFIHDLKSQGPKRKQKTSTARLFSHASRVVFALGLGLFILIKFSLVLLSSEVVLAGLGLRNTIALHAPTASNGRPVSKAPPSNFSCDGRPYGYYADVELECAYFHVCTVKPGADGWRVFVANSFRCEEDHVFDQEQFECRERDEALPCSQAEAYYGGNSVWN
ncbi:hypothetical protein HPB48_004632 [Haemaphysalis longicornis]|uniref:Chitin-binding type-2 domain-containing protein n=1 Tax=Haemaphysalis longicornis TaxID=44386 RepID=A0A9J6G083_HAELO|nr:hypothetical protein HPB48_004632 [Haemaphysalis longicornis]